MASAASSPTAARTRRFAAADIPDALIAGAALIHLSGYSFFAPSPRAAVLDVMRRAGATPVSVDPASAEFLREVGPQELSRMDEGRGDPLSQRGRGGRPRRARTIPRRSARASPRSIRSSSSSAARRAARRRQARGAGGSPRRRSKRSTRPAPATPSSPPFSPRGFEDAEIDAALKRAVAAGAGRR